ncbi:MAG: hypothetical protein LUD38_14405 [Parabacteroides sp.]|nr:hypothetical protein [Parabacteroides sp.]
MKLYQTTTNANSSAYTSYDGTLTQIQEGNTLRFGYNSSGVAPLTAVMSGTIHVGYGTIEVHNGDIRGVIDDTISTVSRHPRKCRTNNEDNTHVVQTGGNVTSVDNLSTGDTDTATITIAGTGSTYSQSAGTVEKGANITYSGSGSRYYLSDTGSITGTTTGPTTTVNFTSTGKTYFDQTGGEVKNKAQITYNGLGSEYILSGGLITDDGTIVDFTNTGTTYFYQSGGTVTSSAEIKYRGAGSEYNQSGGTVSNAAKINFFWRWCAVQFDGWYRHDQLGHHIQWQ